MTVILEASGLQKTYANGVRAVQDVDLRVSSGETLGIVGESGCGKSTLARILLRLVDPDQGSITFEGDDITHLRGRNLQRLRSKVQVVPQHPQSSLNPRVRVGSSIEFNMRAQRTPRPARRGRIGELLERVGLPPEFARRYPHELSGGQLQRVAIARALSTDPKLVICDEAVSALDKSVQAQVLNLLAELQRDLDVAFIFISHDLAVVEHIADRVLVMYLGRVVEAATSTDLWRDAQHPYSRALLSSTPGRRGARIILRGELPNPSDPPSGCGFRTRCPEAEPRCGDVWPDLITTQIDHAVACVHHPAISTSIDPLQEIHTP